MGSYTTEWIVSRISESAIFFFQSFHPRRETRPSVSLKMAVESAANLNAILSNNVNNEPNSNVKWRTLNDISKSEGKIDEEEQQKKRGTLLPKL